MAIWEGYGRPLRLEFAARAREAAERAIALDSELAEPHVALGFVDLFENHFSGAEQHFRTALRIDPGHPRAALWLAYPLFFAGRQEEALLLADRAVDLDPLAVIHRGQRGVMLFYARRYDDAEADLREALRMNPNYEVGSANLAMLLLETQRVDSAAVLFVDALPEGSRVQPDEMNALVRSSTDPARRAEAVEIVNRLAAERRMAWSWLATWAAKAGHPDLAVEYLERALQEREWMIYAGAHPAFDDLREHPRYLTMLRRLGLPAL